MIRRAALLAGCFAVLLSAQTAGASTVTPAERNVEVGIFQKINNKRVSLGKNALVEHALMRSLAERHSDAMAAKHTLGHFGFSKRVATLRANDSGITGYVCENVAYASGYSASQAIGVIFQGWMHSAPHRKCMLDQNGYVTQSAAVGIAHVGSTWWATYIAAHDTSP